MSTAPTNPTNDPQPPVEPTLWQLIWHRRSFWDWTFLAVEVALILGGMKWGTEAVRQAGAHHPWTAYPATKWIAAPFVATALAKSIAEALEDDSERSKKIKKALTYFGLIATTAGIGYVAGVAMEKGYGGPLWLGLGTVALIVAYACFAVRRR